jgi:hypothetical protein
MGLKYIRGDPGFKKIHSARKVQISSCRHPPSVILSKGHFRSDSMGRPLFSFVRLAGLRQVQITSLIVLALLILSTAQAQPKWPQEITHPEATIVVYQPQPEKLEGNLLSGRAAISIEQTGKEPIFGAMWFTARLHSGEEADVITVQDLKVTQVTWPDSKDVGEQKFIDLVESTMPEAGFDISRERPFPGSGSRRVWKQQNWNRKVSIN